jgi:hypothetical protein
MDSPLCLCDNFHVTRTHFLHTPAFRAVRVRARANEMAALHLHTEGI